MKMKSTACESAWVAGLTIINVAIRATIATVIKAIRIHLRSAGASFLNFMENIGISLTSSMESMPHATGIIHVLSVNAPTILLRS